MSLIPANRSEIVVGQPIPWALYTQEYNLLLKEGDVVRDDKHLEELLSSGACHELSWETAEGSDPDYDGGLAAAEETASAAKAASDADSVFTFDDMRLKVEDRLQLEPPAQLARERFSVKVIGYLRGASLLVTAPVTANGLRLQLMESEKVVMRSFSGQNAFGFACTIERIIKIPYEYIHLSFPDVIQGIKIRKAPRIKTHIIATVSNSKSDTATQKSTLISDVSADGVSLEAKHPLGDKGDVVQLAFRVQLHNVDAYLSVKGIIRAVFSGNDAPDTKKSDLIRHGIQFKDLQPNDSVVLQSMIYQQMIENPHLVM